MPKVYAAVFFAFRNRPYQCFDNQPGTLLYQLSQSSESPQLALHLISRQSPPSPVVCYPSLSTAVGGEGAGHEWSQHAVTELLSSDPARHRRPQADHLSSSPPPPRARRTVATLKPSPYPAPPPRARLTVATLKPPPARRHHRAHASQSLL